MAATQADVMVVTAATASEVHARRAEVRDRAATAGRDPDTVAVLATVDALGAECDPAATGVRRRLDELGPAPEPPGLDYHGGAAGFADRLGQLFDAGVLDGALVRPMLLGAHPAWSRAGDDARWPSR